MKGFARAMGFLAFCVPLVGIGLMCGWSLVADGQWLTGPLTAITWSATGVVLGKHASSGFSRHSLLTAGMALIFFVANVYIIDGLHDRGSRSAAELVFGASIFFLTAWALVAIPVGMTKGLKRAWTNRHNHKTQRHFAMAVPVCVALVGFVSYACWYLDASPQTALAIIWSAALILGLFLTFYYFAFRRRPPTTHEPKA